MSKAAACVFWAVALHRQPSFAGAVTHEKNPARLDGTSCYAADWIPEYPPPAKHHHHAPASASSRQHQHQRQRRLLGAPKPDKSRWATLETSPVPCKVTKTYHASAQEEAWRRNIDVWAGDRDDAAWEPGCRHMQEMKSTVKHWLDVWKQREGAGTCRERVGLARAFNASLPLLDTTAATPAADGLLDPAAALPYFTLTDSCAPGAVVRLPIEPLVGFLRHPLHQCFDASGAFSTSKDYLLPAFDAEVLPSPHRTVRSQKLLFDLGCSRYGAGLGGASQSWFVDTYRKHGVAFDRILAWEFTPQDPKVLLGGYPPDVLDVLSYYNVGADPSPSGRHNPLRTLKHVASAADFVVLKIDIDTAWAESRFVAQILDDPAIWPLIDELYFEHHVHRSPMAKQGWIGYVQGNSVDEGMANETRHFTSAKLSQGRFPVRADNDITASYEIFHAMRERGIRAHSWV